MADELTPPEAAVAKNAQPGGNDANAGAGGAAPDVPPQPNPASPGGEGQPAPAGASDGAADKGTAKLERDPLLPDKLEEEDDEGGKRGEGGEDNPEGKELPEGAVDVDGVPLVLPEGISADNEEFRSVVGMMKELNVPNEAIQKLTDYHVNYARKVGAMYAEGDANLRATLNKRWTRECNADPEFGGKSFDASCNYVQAALRKYFTEEELMATEEKDGRMGFLEFRDQANLRNHPLLFRLLARVGKASMGAIPISSGGAAPQKEVTAADRMFPHLPSAAH